MADVEGEGGETEAYQEKGRDKRKKEGKRKRRKEESEAMKKRIWREVEDEKGRKAGWVHGRKYAEEGEEE